MHRLLAHIRSNLVGWVALFVALGGTSYAAISIPRGSVGAPQLKNHAITPVKLNPADIGGNVRAWAIVGADGRLIAGSGKPVVTTTAVAPGEYGIRWSTVLPRNCATVANIDQRSSATETVQLPGGSQQVVGGYVSQVESRTTNRASKPRLVSTTALVTLNQAGQPTPLAFDVAVIC